MGEIDLPQGRYDPLPNRFLTVTETSAVLRVTENTVREYIARGRLPARRWGRRWLVPREAVEAFVEDDEDDDDDDQSEGGA